MKTKTYYPSVVHMILGNPIKTAGACFATVIVMLLFINGCSSNSAPSADELKPENITYFKDTRTGVCYAAMDSLDVHSGWKTTTITYVPCTPEVEKLIH